ncbi:MAG: heparinase II/III-family protein [Clostridia bacterium]|nr:heparinase II/III-family protein [Clostridia bacterium]
MQHPYLFFSKADARLFSEKMKTDAALKEKYEKTVSECEKYLGEEFITEEQANGRNTQSQHADFGSINGQASRMGYVLGAKYIIDGDARCAEKLKKLVLHYISFERWFAHSYEIRIPVPWHADLCSVGITLALAKIYDIIFDYLTEDERKSIAGGILEKGVMPALGDWALPEKRIHALDSMGHNWWAVCIAEAATAFLAVSDYVPEREKKYVLDCVDRALADYMTYKGNRLFNKLGNFDDAGFFYESVGYNNFGTGTLLEYLWCNERYFGENRVIRCAIPDGLCTAVMKMAYPYTRNGKTFYEFLPFGDHSPGKEISLLAKYCVLTGIADSSMRACAATYGADLWDEFIGYNPGKNGGSVEYLPKTALYSSGYAVTRSSWDNDATLFAVKSGFCWNHSHNDSGSFMLYHKGKPFFKDCGTCNYDSPLYHAYYCQDSAHSVLKIGNAGRRDEELYRGTKFPGELTDSFVSDGLFFVQADTAGPMAHLCSRLFRNFFWLDNRLLVIFDEAYCHEENTVQLTLHFDGEYEKTENAVLFTNEDSKARLISHYPENMSLCEKEGHADHKENETEPYIELSTVQKERTHLLIHSIELDYDEHETAVSLIEGNNSTGIKITDADTERQIWFNSMADGHVMHDNSNNIICGFDTDAYMLVITRDNRQKTEKVLAVCASYLRRDGKVYLSSFEKTTAEVITEI